MNASQSREEARRERNEKVPFDQEGEGSGVSFKMQVVTGNGWADVRSGDCVYRYPTKDAAESALRMCYPEQCRQRNLGAPAMARVVEDSEPANMGVT